MKSNSQWAYVALTGILGTLVTILLLNDVPVQSIGTAFGMLGGLIGTIVLYAKLHNVEKNTNGALTEQMNLVKDYIEYAKQSAPMDQKKE